MRPRPLLILPGVLLCSVLLGCPAHRPGAVRPVPRDSTPRRNAPVVVRDTALEQRASRLELQLLEKQAQVEELQSRLDDARREVVRAMAKLQTLATRAEAASGMAEAEIALQSLRTATGGGAASAQTAPEIGQTAQLLQLAVAEFDKQNYGGALYLATQAKTVAAAGQGRLATLERGALRAGEVAFAVPLHLETTGRANVREGPGGNFSILFTLDGGASVTGYSYLDQWVRIADASGRAGWIFQGLIDRRQ